MLGLNSLEFMLHVTKGMEGCIPALGFVSTQEDAQEVRDRVGGRARFGGKNEVNKKKRILIKPPPKQDGWLVEDMGKFSIVLLNVSRVIVFLLLCPGYVELL